MTNRHEIAVVLGARPEITKLARVVRGLGEGTGIISTAQPDGELSEEFLLRALGLPQARLSLPGLGGSSRGVHIAKGIGRLVQYFEARRPRLVIVHGDTETAAAGAQAGNYCGIPVLHVGAGLRSYNRDRPEETNRRIVSVLADIHCTPTVYNASNLLAEGVGAEQIRVTGDPVVESTLEAAPCTVASRETLNAYGLAGGDFILATIHHPESTDNVLRLERTLRELASLPLPVVFPVHPRTAARVLEFGLEPLMDKLRHIPPLDHTAFLALAGSARLLISDSDGVLEECTILKKPVIILHDSTGRPEAVFAGFAVRAVRGEIIEKALDILADEYLSVNLKSVASPFGDGRATARIVTIAAAMARGEIPPFTNLDHDFRLGYELPFMDR